MSKQLTGCVALALVLSGCECGGGTVGLACEDDRDCDRGEYCDPVTMTCQLVMEDSGPPGPDVGVGCNDEDGDTVSDCAGDCDDANPTIYPGATEVCGDGITNDCSSNPPDSGCGGIGTFVAPPPTGSDTNPGTQASPVATIGQGLVNAMTIGGGVDVYVAAGTYAEDITMVEGISLLGGHDETTWARDPATNVSTIQSNLAPGLTVPHGITRATEVDGFTIQGRAGGGSATSLTIMDGSSPTISNNVIVGPDTGGYSIGIDINPANIVSPGMPLIEDNVITLGPSAGGWGAANGSNGIRAQQTVVEVLRNRFNFVADDSIQAAMLIGASPPTSIVEGNVVRSLGTPAFAFGLRMAWSNIEVRDNDFDLGTSAGGTRGIATGGEGITQRVENNIVLAGNGPGITIAFAVEYEGLVPMPPPDLIVHSNFLHGGLGGGTTIGVGLGECPPTQFAVGRFYNNIIYSGDGGTRYAVVEQHPSVDFAEMQGNALYRPAGGTGALFRDEGLPGVFGCVPAGVGTDEDLAGLNALTGAGSNIEDACAVVNPTSGGDFHLGSGSACENTGVSTALPATDYEGDARPSGTGPDIGVDEVVP